MAAFLFQVVVQGIVIAALWFFVHRDASKLRERHGSTPGNFSAFAWGALCGLTWVAVIPYFIMRRRVADDTAPTQERNLLTWWIGLALATAYWASTQLAHHDVNNGTQHVLLAGLFVACALIAWSRDRKLEPHSSP